MSVVNSLKIEQLPGRHPKQPDLSYGYHNYCGDILRAFTSFLSLNEARGIWKQDLAFANQTLKSNG